MFTVGVGENAPSIRFRAAIGLEFIGVTLDEQVNAGARPDAEIGRSGSTVRSYVIAAREDIQMAREVRAVTAERSARP